MIDFMCKYSFEKGYYKHAVNDDVREMDVDVSSLNNEEHSSDDLSKYLILL